MKKRKITIDDVAKKANVSKATVSRYLNGKYEYMSEETKQKIRDVIKELNYRPSKIAKSLKAKHSKIIGCLIADIGNYFSSMVLKGINDVCDQLGYQVLFANTDDNPNVERRNIQALLDSKVDGLIINTTGEIEDYLLELKNRGVKIVLADRSFSKENVFDTVTSNNHEVTYQTIKYLFSEGYQHVAFFTEEMGNNSARYLRHKGYLDGMKDFFQLDGKKFTYISKKNDLLHYQKNVKEYLKTSNGKPVAILAVNGLSLLNVLQAVKNLNISIPDELGVCGFDNWSWFSLISPGITTIEQQSYQCGALSAKLLIEKINNPQLFEIQHIKLPAKLVIRGSTKLKR